MGIDVVDRLADNPSEEETYPAGNRVGRQAPEQATDRMVLLSPYDLDTGERDECSKKTSELWLVLRGNRRRSAA